MLPNTGSVSGFIKLVIGFKQLFFPLCADAINGEIKLPQAPIAELKDLVLLLKKQIQNVLSV